MDNQNGTLAVFALLLLCLLFSGPVDAQLETTTACYGVDGCNLFQLICKGGNFIKVVYLHYGAKNYSCTNDVKGDKCLKSGGCCEYNPFDCFETFSQLHTDTVYNACAEKTSCGPLQAPFNRLSSCKNELSTYVVIQHECVTEIPTTLATTVKHTTQPGTSTARATTVPPNSSKNPTTSAPLSTETLTPENTSIAFSSATTSNLSHASSTNAPTLAASTSASATTKFHIPVSSNVTASSTSFSTTSQNGIPEASNSTIVEDDNSTTAILTGILVPVLLLAIIGVIVGFILWKRGPKFSKSPPLDNIDDAEVNVYAEITHSTVNTNLNEPLHHPLYESRRLGNAMANHHISQNNATYQIQRQEYDSVYEPRHPNSNYRPNGAIAPKTIIRTSETNQAVRQDYDCVYETGNRKESANGNCATASRPNTRTNELNHSTRQDYDPVYAPGMLTKHQDRSNPRAEAATIRVSGTNGSSRQDYDPVYEPGRFGRNAEQVNGFNGHGRLAQQHNYKTKEIKADNPWYRKAISFCRDKAADISTFISKKLHKPKTRREQSSSDFEVEMNTAPYRSASMEQGQFGANIRNSVQVFQIQQHSDEDMNDEDIDQQQRRFQIPKRSPPYPENKDSHIAGQALVTEPHSDVSHAHVPTTGIRYDDDDVPDQEQMDTDQQQRILQIPKRPPPFPENKKSPNVVQALVTEPRSAINHAHVPTSGIRYDYDDVPDPEPMESDQQQKRLQISIRPPPFPKNKDSQIAVHALVTEPHSDVSHAHVPTTANRYDYDDVPDPEQMDTDQHQRKLQIPKRPPPFPEKKNSLISIQALVTEPRSVISYVHVPKSGIIYDYDDVPDPEPMESDQQQRRIQIPKRPPPFPNNKDSQISVHALVTEPRSVICHVHVPTTGIRYDYDDVPDPEPTEADQHQRKLQIPKRPPPFPENKNYPIAVHALVIDPRSDVSETHVPTAGVRYDYDDVPDPEISGSNTVPTRPIAFYNPSFKNMLRNCRQSEQSLNKEDALYDSAYDANNDVGLSTHNMDGRLTSSGVLQDQDNDDGPLYDTAYSRTDEPEREVSDKVRAQTAIMYDTDGYLAPDTARSKHAQGGFKTDLRHISNTPNEAMSARTPTGKRISGNRDSQSDKEIWTLPCDKQLGKSRSESCITDKANAAYQEKQISIDKSVSNSEFTNIAKMEQGSDDAISGGVTFRRSCDSEEGHVPVVKCLAKRFEKKELGHI